MRFLANENVPGPVIRQLRELGHDWVGVFAVVERDRVRIRPLPEVP